MIYKSLDIIHDEHRALAAMLSGLRALAASIEAGRLQPDFDLMASMIEYIDKVPEKVHHPKENEFLFAKLRLRCAEALPAIEALEEEHRLGDARIAGRPGPGWVQMWQEEGRWLVALTEAGWAWQSAA